MKASASIKCSLKLYNRGENLVKVYAFDLGEAFCYKVGVLAAITFDIENPAVVYDFVAFWHVDKFEYVSLFEHIKLSGTHFSPFFLSIRW